MSRYRKITKEGRELVWGFDYPLGEYFFSCTKTAEEKEKEKEKLSIEAAEEIDEYLFHIGSYTTFTPHPDYPDLYCYSKSELVPIMEQFKEYIPKEHIDAIVLDVPF